MIIFKRFVRFQYVKIYIGLVEARWINMGVVVVHLFT